MEHGNVGDPGDDFWQLKIGTAGDTETDITSSKTSFHRVTGINSQLK